MTKPDQASMAAEQKRNLVFELLKPVAKAIVQTFGTSCEVVIHDLADLEHSIVWIEGNVTNRRVGGSLTDLGLAKIRSGDTTDLFSYTTFTDDGKTLKSCSIFLRDEKGEVIGALCINVDVSTALAFDHLLHSFIKRDDNHDIVESFSDDIGEILETVISESVYEIGKPITLMNKAEKVRLVRMLDERGVFQVKKAVPHIASRLRVSRHTIYNYLTEIRDETEEQDESLTRDGQSAA